MLFIDKEFFLLSGEKIDGLAIQCDFSNVFTPFWPPPQEFPTHPKSLVPLNVPCMMLLTPSPRPPQLDRHSRGGEGEEKYADSWRAVVGQGSKVFPALCSLLLGGSCCSSMCVAEEQACSMLVQQPSWCGLHKLLLMLQSLPQIHIWFRAALPKAVLGEGALYSPCSPSCPTDVL